MPSKERVPSMIREEIMDGVFLKAQPKDMAMLRSAYYTTIRAAQLIEVCNKKENPASALKKFGYEMVPHGTESILIDHGEKVVLALFQVKGKSSVYRMHVIPLDHCWSIAVTDEDKQRLIVLGQFARGTVTIVGD